MGNATNGEGFFLPDKANLTRQYSVYCKKNCRSMAEKDPPFGHVGIFQTRPSISAAEMAMNGTLAIIPNR